MLKNGLQFFSLGEARWQVCRFVSRSVAEHQLFNFQSRKVRHAIAEVEALDRSQAVIEFGLDGTILNANENLLKLSGYSLAEIKGKHHSIFVSPAERESARYRDFRASLDRGEFQTTQYRRFGKNGKELWIHASYAPLLDESGKVVSFIKFATDITAYKMRTMEDAGKIRRCREFADRDQDRDRRRQRIHRLHRRRGRGAEHRDVRHVGQHAARLGGAVVGEDRG